MTTGSPSCNLSHPSPSAGAFSLIEVTIALGIFGSSVLVLLGLTAITSEFALANREMTQASQLAAKIFTDLSQPQQNALPDDRNRALNLTAPVSTPYGGDISPTVEHHDETPLAWLFSSGLTALPAPDGSDMAMIYENGSAQEGAEFVVGISFANESRYHPVPAVPPPAPLPGAPVMKRVLVSVEAPAGVRKAFRRKYEFYRIMQFR